MFTRPTARVLALLEILQAGGLHTVPTLAGHLEVDERTVRRYVAHLIDLDIPVRSVRGRYGGYRLAPGYRMPPLMSTEDEAVAVLIGLTAGRRTGLATALPAATDAAAAKVRRVLPAALGRRLDGVLETAAFSIDTESIDAPSIALPSTDVLLTPASAVRRRQPVGITYTSSDDRGSERTIHLRGQPALPARPDPHASGTRRPLRGPGGIRCHRGRRHRARPDAVPVRDRRAGVEFRRRDPRETARRRDRRGPRDHR